jgi:hypothetical protein
VIVHAEIALEPHTDGRAGVGHDDQIPFTQDSGPAADTPQKYRPAPDPTTFLGRGSGDQALAGHIAIGGDCGRAAVRLAIIAGSRGPGSVL